MRRLGLPFRDVDWTRLGRAAAPGAPARARGRGRAGRQVRRPARRLPLGHRGAAGRRLRPTTPRCGSAGSPPTTARPRRAPGARSPASTRSACPAASACAASRASSARCAGPASTSVPTLGLCLGLQCMVIEYARNVAGLAGAVLDRVRPGQRAPGDRDDGGAEGHRRRRRRPGRHDAAGALPGRRWPTARWSARRTARRACSERHRHRYEVNNAYREPARAGRPGVLRHLAGRRRWSSSSSCRATCTRTTSPPRPTRSSGRGPNRAHPLFAGLVAAAVARQRESRLVEVERHRERCDRRPVSGVDDSGRLHDLVAPRPVSAPSSCTPAWSGTSGATPSTSGAAGVVTGGSSSGTPARSGSSRWTTRTGWPWSTSTATRSAWCSGSCRPACSTSPASPPVERAQRELAEEADLRGRAAGTCWSTGCCRRAAARRRSAASWPATCRRCRRRSATSGRRGAGHAGPLGRPGRAPRRASSPGGCTAPTWSSACSRRWRRASGLGHAAAGGRAVARAPGVPLAVLLPGSG